MRYQTPLCPQSEAHGPLLAWTGELAGWYCPHTKHADNKFYRTDLSPAPRPEQQTGPGGQARRSAAPTGASEPFGGHAVASDPDSANTSPLVDGVRVPTAWTEAELREAWGR